MGNWDGRKYEGDFYEGVDKPEFEGWVTILELGLGSGGRHGGDLEVPAWNYSMVRPCSLGFLGHDWRWARTKESRTGTYIRVCTPLIALMTQSISFLVVKRTPNWLLRFPTSRESQCSQENRQMSHAGV